MSRANSTKSKTFKFVCTKKHSQQRDRLSKRKKTLLRHCHTSISKFNHLNYCVLSKNKKQQGENASDHSNFVQFQASVPTIRASIERHFSLTMFRLKKLTLSFTKPLTANITQLLLRHFTDP